MRQTVIQFVVLLCSLATCQPIEGQRRISQIKCEDYRSRTKENSTGIYLTANPKPVTFEASTCNRTVELIVGGVEAGPQEFPHQALIGWKVKDTEEYEFHCGGSLISEYYVLTAAHCTSHDGQRPMIVRLAEMDLANEFDNQEDFEIKNITRFVEYSFNQSYHDIALIRLMKEVMFSDSIRPACLWDLTELNFTSVIATGFGLTDFMDEEMSDKLLKVQLNELDREMCQSQLRTRRRYPQGIKDSQLCYGSQEEEKDTCHGDSGGPIQVLTKSGDCTYFVVGVTSGGSACGVRNTPAIYTRVASYIDWIESIVWPLSG